MATLVKKGSLREPMTSRQPTAQVSRQQTASSKPPGNSPSALQRIMPEVPSSPKATSQMSAGRQSLREALITKLLKKYSPVSISHYDIGSSSFF
jgi:hypothetical protein